MPIVLLIIAGIPLLSVVWWIWVDRRLSRLGATRGWRIGMSLLVMVILIGFSWVLLARREMVTMQIPAAMYALVLLWGLIFLPFMGIPIMFGWSIGSLGIQFLKRRRPVDFKPRRIQTVSEYLEEDLFRLVGCMV